MTFRLVRAEPSEKQIAAGERVRSPDSIGRSGDAALIYRVMASYSEPPTDAEIDELCIALCRAEAPGGALPWQWHKERDGAWIWRAQSGDDARDAERVIMRAFIAALEGERQ